MNEDAVILDAFVRICGEQDAWNEDRCSWLAALGAFMMGWKAATRTGTISACEGGEGRASGSPLQAEDEGAKGV